MLVVLPANILVQVHQAYFVYVHTAPVPIRALFFLPVYSCTGYIIYITMAFYVRTTCFRSSPKTKKREDFKRPMPLADAQSSRLYSYAYKNSPLNFHNDSFKFRLSSVVGFTVVGRTGSFTSTGMPQASICQIPACRTTYNINIKD